MSEYQPGRLVACIDDGFVFRDCHAKVELPVKGKVYRIRAVVIHPIILPDLGRTRIEFLRLAEIVNPEFPTMIGFYEPSFEASGFRPLDDRRLDVFRRKSAPWRITEGARA
jgi:hypothetical protein